MDRRAASVLLVVLLMGALACAVASPAKAQSNVTVPFDLGYGPSTLFPASQGTPVFSTGDQLWVTSHYNTTLLIMVSYILSNSTYFLGPVRPGTPTKLLLFDATYPQGMWSLRALNSSLSPVLFLVSDAAGAPANLALAQARLRGGDLEMNFTTSFGLQFQGAQACTIGSQNSSAAVVPVPAQSGGGTVTLSMDGNEIDATEGGPGTGNFTLQVDLYYSYAFLAPNSTSILLFRSARVATTGAVLITNSNPSASMLLQSDGRLKTGRYELRIFFDGAQGLSLATTEVLVTDSNSWVWLGACTNTPVYSNSFSITTPLGAGPVSWPRTLWLTYTVFGEQGFANISLGVDIAALTFLGSPWGVPLSSYDVGVVTSTGTKEIDVQNGTMFMILSSPQASANYTLGLGGQTFFRGTAGPIEPFTSTTLPFNVSELAVTYFSGGSPYRGGNVSVSDSEGELVSAETNSHGQAFFYLPPGGYNVAAAGGNGSASMSVTLSLGQKFTLELGLQTSTGTSNIALVWVLAATAATGAVVNAIVFLRGRRNRP